MSKSVKSQFNWFFIHEKMDPDSEYEEVDVIVPEHTPVTFAETNALIEKAMARMGVTTFEEFCIQSWKELEGHSKQ